MGCLEFRAVFGVVRVVVLREMPLPLPPVAVQRRLVARVIRHRQVIERRRATAAARAAEVKARVEAMIVGT